MHTNSHSTCCSLLLASFRLAAAREFELADFNDWMLLEASDHLGGRILTNKETYNGIPVEIGQRYIQEIQRNPLYDLAREIGFRMHPVNWNKVVVYDENVKEVKKPPFTEWDKAFGCAEELGKVLNQDKDDYVIDGREVLAQCGWEDETNTPVRDAIAWLDMEFEYGCNPDEASFVFVASRKSPKASAKESQPCFISSVSTSFLGMPFPSLGTLIQTV